MSYSYLMKEGNQRVIDLINRDNGLDLQPNWVNFGVPIPAIDHLRNTEVRIYPTSEYQVEHNGEMKPVKGSSAVFYDRLDVKTEIEAINDDSIVYVDGLLLNNLHSAIDQINAEYGLVLTPADFDDVVIDKSQFIQVLNVRINANSLVYTGEFTVHFYNVDWSRARMTTEGIRRADGGMRMIKK